MTQLAGHTPTAWRSRRGDWYTRVASRATDVFQMVKPRLSVMVVATAYVGYAMGLKVVGSGYGAWLIMAATLVGVALCCMGASVLNQVYEWDTDALMARTRNRPLPAGRVQVGGALVMGVGLCVAGVGLLAVMANLLTAGLAAFTVVSYALVYTPMKRVSSLSTVVGAVPGALPPVMGYTAATGRLGVEALLLFGVLFLWQLPHFLAIAWLYRDQYASARMVLLPVVDPGGGSTFRQIFLGCLTLVPLGLLPTMVGVCGTAYFWGSLLAGICFLGFGVALVIGQTRRHARAMFFASLVYLPVVLAMMLADQIGPG